MAFINDLHRDEIRDGWLVTEDMKKVWNRQLEIWHEVDRICRKHGITYWAACGTLLGAARHKGFIPWDNDMDFILLRPEYDRFCNVLDDELNRDLFEICSATFSLMTISHKLTTGLESNYGRKNLFDDNINHKPQGLGIDIFALDIAPDGTENSVLAFKAMQEIMAAVTDISQVVEMTHAKKDGYLVMELETLQQIAALPSQERLAELYRYTYELWNQSSEVAYYSDVLNKLYKANIKKDWLRETIYLPFETVEMPAPKMFDEVLTAYYGDWRTPVNDGENRLGVLHSADIPWREFFRQVDVQKILNDWNRKHNP